MTRTEQHVADALKASSAYTSIPQAAAAGTSFGQLLGAEVAAWGEDRGRRYGDHESELTEAFADAITQAVAQATPHSCTLVFLDAAYSALSTALKDSRT